MSRILLALDHTPLAHEATRGAIDHARAEAADLVIVGLATPTFDVQPGSGDGLRRHADVRAAVASALRHATHAGVTTQVLGRSLLVNGDRDQRLRALASEVGADRIVHVEPSRGILRGRGTVTNVAVAQREAARDALAA